MNRRAFLLASALALSPFAAFSAVSLVAFPADASTARLLTLDELVGISTYVVVATAGEAHSVWEDLPSGRRIVTYTRLAIERAVTGAPGTEVWVRTLGGAVDKIGQAVPGEARLAAGSRSLLFLAQVNGVVVVAAMAQGHYPIVADEKGTLRLAPSPDTGMLVPRAGPSISAHEVLVGGTVADGVSRVLAVRRARDEKK